MRWKSSLNFLQQHSNNNVDQEVPVILFGVRCAEESMKKKLSIIHQFIYSKKLNNYPESFRDNSRRSLYRYPLYV
jgi:hypothetical protein